MALEWDYGAAAAAYDLRPPYVAAALAASFAAAELAAGDAVCDVGAGTGRLTSALLERGAAVVAVEPNPAMRERGIVNTGRGGGRAGGRAEWIGGRAEALPVATASCRLVSFGSSFNVVDRAAALAEAARVLVPNGRLLCIWNHRVLDDPLQRRIEAVIRRYVPDYGHGSRRDDQTSVLAASGRFGHVRRLAALCVHRVPSGEWLQAWRSHLTLRRQAGARFEEVLAAIDRLVAAEAGPEVAVPYETRAWLAARDGGG